MSSLDRRTALGIGLVGLAAPVGAIAPAMREAPSLELVATLRINVAAPQEQGMIDGKRKRFIPITGGSMDGPRLKGEVLPGAR